MPGCRTAPAKSGRKPSPVFSLPLHRRKTGPTANPGVERSVSCSTLLREAFVLPSPRGVSLRSSVAERVLSRVRCAPGGCPFLTRNLSPATRSRAGSGKFLWKTGGPADGCTHRFFFEAGRYYEGGLSFRTCGSRKAREVSVPRTSPSCVRACLRIGCANYENCLRFPRAFRGLSSLVRQTVRNLLSTYRTVSAPASR